MYLRLNIFLTTYVKVYFLPKDIKLKTLNALAIMVTFVNLQAFETYPIALIIDPSTRGRFVYKKQE